MYPSQIDKGMAFLDKLIFKHSSWYIAWIVRVKSMLLESREKKPDGTKEGISEDGMERAEIEVVKHVERQSFKEEFDTLQMKIVDEAPKQRQQFNKTNAIRRLDSVMSEDGVILVGGRLKNAKHPIILKQTPCLRSHHT